MPYNETLELIENKLSSIKLKLNTEKTELIDLSNLDNKEEKFFDMVTWYDSDSCCYEALLLSIQTNFKMGKANRVFKWQLDTGSNFDKYIKQIAPLQDNNNAKKRDVYGEEIRTICDDFSIIALQDEKLFSFNYCPEDESSPYIAFLRFMLESKLSVAMKVRLIKENVEMLKYEQRSFFEKNDYYLYVLLNCIIQNFAINNQKDFANVNGGSIVKWFCSDNTTLHKKIKENKILKEVFDYLQLNKKATIGAN